MKARGSGNGNGSRLHGGKFQRRMPVGVILEQKGALLQRAGELIAIADEDEIELGVALHEIDHIDMAQCRDAGKAPAQLGPLGQA